MFNLDTLPKVIEHNGAHYNINLSIVNSLKFFLSYQYNGSSERAHAMKKPFNILPQTVESDMEGEPIVSDDIFKDVNVPDLNVAVKVIGERLEKAIEDGKIKVVTK